MALRVIHFVIFFDCVDVFQLLSDLVARLQISTIPCRIDLVSQLMLVWCISSVSNVSRQEGHAASRTLLLYER